jgi:glutamine---fructose-6-phosphate transaminase (isomerizing)
MCGIFGYIGNQDPIAIALGGLKRLEYRGYDSAGIAGISAQKQIVYSKEIGKVSQLEASIVQSGLKFEGLAIAQTRWATHGKVTQANAHPTNTCLGS